MESHGRNGVGRTVQQGRRLEARKQTDGQTRATPQLPPPSIRQRRAFPCPAGMTGEPRPARSRVRYSPSPSRRSGELFLKQQFFRLMVDAPAEGNVGTAIGSAERPRGLNIRVVATRAPERGAWAWMMDGVGRPGHEHGNPALRPGLASWRVGSWQPHHAHLLSLTHT